MLLVVTKITLCSLTSTIQKIQKNEAIMIFVMFFNRNKLCQVKYTIDIQATFIFITISFVCIQICELTYSKIKHTNFKSLLLGACLFTLYLMESFPIGTSYSYRSAIWLYLCGDIELNPGPKTEHFRFCHWNLNSIPAHGFSRLSLMHAYMLQHDIHIAALSETALKPEIPNSDIEIPGYLPIRYDLIGDDTHGGVIIYHKHDLSVKLRSDLPTPSYTLILELSVNKKQIFYILSYRKFGQSKSEAKNFAKKYDEMLEVIEGLNPYMTIVVGDFNAHHNLWYNNDKTDSNGRAIK